MATIHVFRHAQAMHNVDVRWRNVRDPPLTDVGIQQCMDFQSQFPFMDRVTHIIASPMQRTIESALIAFAPAFNRGMPVTLLPEIMETGSNPSGFGSGRQEILDRYDTMVDASRIPSTFANLDPESPYAYEVNKINTRFEVGRNLLMNLALSAGEGAHIVVVTHSRSCHFLTDDYQGLGPEYRCVWDGNLCYRSYKVSPTYGRLIELAESRVRRGVPVPNLLTDDVERAHLKDKLLEIIKRREPWVRELYARYRRNPELGDIPPSH